MAISGVLVRTFRLLKSAAGLALLCILLAASWPGIAVAQETPVLELDGLNYTLLRHPVVFTRVVERVDLETLLRQAPEFTVLDDADVNQGVTDDSFWLHVRLRNSGSEPKHWVLHHETTYLDEMAVWLADEGEAFASFTLSDHMAFASRPLNYRKLGFEHVTPAGSYTDLYVRLAYLPGRADAMNLDLHLWDTLVWGKQLPREHLQLGMYYGYVACLLFFSLVLVLVLRQRAYLHYGLLVLSTGFMWLNLHGVGFQYLWPDQPQVHNQGFHISYLLLVLAALQFSRVFLNTATLLPRMDRVLQGLMVLAGVGLLLRLAGFYTPVLHWTVFCLSALTLLPVLGWICWRQGERHAFWYMLAWGVYMCTVLLAVLSAYTRILHWGMEPLLLTQFGSVLENVLLLFATAQRVIILERERSAAMHLAYTDSLTRLGNRRFLTRGYNARITRFAPGDTPLFLLLIDLDDFKGINDTFGHAAGDRVLVDVAQLMVAGTRADDLCVRYGGEEFALLVQAANREAAVELAERLRVQFAANPSRYRGQDIHHTLSIGLTVACEGRRKLEEKEALRCADIALYQAKQQGRNRVVLYGDGGAGQELEAARLSGEAGVESLLSPPRNNHKIQEET